jgi:ESF2/ABP1 family protein
VNVCRCGWPSTDNFHIFRKQTDEGDYVEGSSMVHDIQTPLDSESEGQEYSAGEKPDVIEDSDLEDDVDKTAGDKNLKPLSETALAEFEKAQQKAGIIYISRIPPGMRPAKVKHLMSNYGKVGRVFLQQEGKLSLMKCSIQTHGSVRHSDPKRAYLRRKHTSTKKVHYTEGWVEFESKHVARSVAEMLNAQPIGGKKGSRWRDDIWTMKYLPKFKWNMLTEQVGKPEIDTKLYLILKPCFRSPRGCCTYCPLAS